MEVFVFLMIVNLKRNPVYESPQKLDFRKIKYFYKDILKKMPKLGKEGEKIWRNLTKERKKAHVTYLGYSKTYMLKILSTLLTYMNQWVWRS